MRLAGYLTFALHYRLVEGLASNIYRNLCLACIISDEQQAIARTALYRAALEHRTVFGSRGNFEQSTVQDGLTVSKRRRLRKLRSIARDKELLAELLGDLQLKDRKQQHAGQGRDICEPMQGREAGVGRDGGRGGQAAGGDGLHTAGRDSFQRPEGIGGGDCVAARACDGFGGAVRRAAGGVPGEHQRLAQHPA